MLELLHFPDKSFNHLVPHMMTENMIESLLVVVLLNFNVRCFMSQMMIQLAAFFNRNHVLQEQKATNPSTKKY
jgi:hypothetical protein